MYTFALKYYLVSLENNSVFGLINVESFVRNQFAQEIIRWYQKHQRDLPWRKTSDPYYIWLSEIILQQTRVKQGLPYYLNFVEQYPNIEDLAQASEDEVLRLWQGLGYYSRGRNLHYTAKYIVQELNGKFPDDYKSLLKLKGVGKYTAAAIASFAFGEQVAVVDGNVYRVLARYFGVEKDIATTEAAKVFANLAQELIPENDPGTYNQAVMEFGALQCTPKKPDCLFCPIQANCVAFHQGKQSLLPIKNPKIKVKKRYFHYLILSKTNQLYLRKRSNEDIWGGLYDFLLLEEKQLLDFEVLLEKSGLLNFQTQILLKQESETYKHTLTHQKIQAKFYQIELQDNNIPSNWFKKHSLEAYTIQEVKELPKPILIDKFLQKKIFTKNI